MASKLKREECYTYYVKGGLVKRGKKGLAAYLFGEFIKDKDYTDVKDAWVDFVDYIRSIKNTTIQNVSYRALQGYLYRDGSERDANDPELKKRVELMAEVRSMYKHVIKSVVEANIPELITEILESFDLVDFPQAWIKSDINTEQVRRRIEKLEGDT